MSVTDSKRLFVARLERLLNAQIAASTAAREKLELVDGRSLGIEVVGSGIRVVLRAQGGTLKIEDAGFEETDARLRASPIDLVHLARSQSIARLRETGAELDGKLHVAQCFADVLDLAAPDLEEELAGWIGDIGAHGIARAGESLVRLARATARAFEQNLGEYLTEEAPVLAGSLRLRAFADAVDQLRDDVDRAEARLERLVRRGGAT